LWTRHLVGVKTYSLPFRRDAMKVRAEPHRSIMGRYHAVMADATFVFYTPAAYPPTRTEAEQELT
jgi:hypothetical protein